MEAAIKQWFPTFDMRLSYRKRGPSAKNVGNNCSKARRSNSDQGENEGCVGTVADMAESDEKGMSELELMLQCRVIHQISLQASSGNI